MANVAALNTVYNHFMTTYAPQGSNTKYDTHKKDELRGVYNSIVKMNKDAPLFLLDRSPATQEFVVSLKEGARSLKNVISSISSDTDDEFLTKKTVSSSDEDVITASYIGEASDDAEIPTLEIEVKQLANGQTNRGNYLDPDGMDLEPDTYSFDIRSRDTDYEFQFNIGPDDTNRSVEEKLARLITKSNIGINASVVSDDNGNIALKLESEDTGLKEDAEFLFRVSDDKTSMRQGAVDYLGLDNMTVEPSNSKFILNGEERSTYSNNFTIAKTYELNLNGVSREGETVSVGLKTDIESLTDNISHLIEGYNSFMTKAAMYLDSQPRSNKLVREMTAISGHYGSGLKDIGININENGTIELDKDKLARSARTEGAQDRFSDIKNFTGSVLDKVNKIALDPMEYTQKTVVAYKNPGKTFTSPYVTSNYSGMMFSSYC